MRITQILCNLISNAVKFTPKNGVVKVIAQSVEETAKTVSVKIEVVDTGIGIPEDKLKKTYLNLLVRWIPLSQESMAEQGWG